MNNAKDKGKDKDKHYDTDKGKHKHNNKEKHNDKENDIDKLLTSCGRVTVAEILRQKTGTLQQSLQKKIKSNGK